MRLARPGTRLRARLVVLDLIAVSLTIGVLQWDPPRAAAAALPAEPGTYLLVLDVVTSGGLSLAAAGVPPALIRAVVTEQIVPDGARPVS